MPTIANCTGGSGLGPDRHDPCIDTVEPGETPSLAASAAIHEERPPAGGAGRQIAAVDHGPHRPCAFGLRGDELHAHGVAAPPSGTMSAVADADGHAASTCGSAAIAATAASA